MTSDQPEDADPRLRLTLSGANPAKANDGSHETSATAGWEGSLAQAAGRCARSPLLLRVLSWLDWSSIGRAWLVTGLVGNQPFESSEAIDDTLAALGSFGLARLDRDNIEVANELIADGAAGPSGDPGTDADRSRLLVALLDSTLPLSPAPDPETVGAATEAVRHICAIVGRRSCLMPELLPVLERCAAQLAAQQDHARYVPVAEATVSLSTTALGPDDPGTVTARVIQAASYLQAGRTAEAIGAQERVVADAERLLAPTTKSRSQPGSSWPPATYGSGAPPTPSG